VYRTVEKFTTSTAEQYSTRAGLTTMPNVPWQRALHSEGAVRNSRIRKKIPVVIGIYDLCTVRNTVVYFYRLSVPYVLVSAILNV